LELDYDDEAKLIANVQESSDPAVVHYPEEIGSLVDEFFTDTGELQKDCGHELLLATEQASWVQMLRNLLWGG
jgi:hypothetical protein